MKLRSNKYNLNKQKRMYLILISMMTLSIIMGFFFYFIISNSNKESIINMQTEFFNNITLNKINYIGSLFNSILSNSLYILIIFLLGLSVVGAIFILGIVLIKCFILGFSISSIIGTYGLKGILLAFIYVFPHQILFLIILLLMCFYGCNFCYRLFKHLFMRNIINFKKISEKYIGIFIISITGAILCSLYEVFIMQYLVRLIM